MQKFILFILALGLSVFLYLLQTEHISRDDFNINKFKSNTGFILKKNEDFINNNTKKSDIFAFINENEYKVFTFEGDDFNKLFEYQYTDKKYKIPLDAIDAVTGKWIGNRYVIYMIKKGNNYEIYKTEYPTDSPDKIQYFKIKDINFEEYTNSNKIEIKY